MKNLLKPTKKKITATTIYFLIYIGQFSLFFVFVNNYFRNNVEPAPWFDSVGLIMSLVSYILVSFVLITYLKQPSFSKNKLKIITITPISVFFGDLVIKAIPNFVRFLYSFFSMNSLLGIIGLLVNYILVAFTIYIVVCFVYHIYTSLENSV